MAFGNWDVLKIKTIGILDFVLALSMTGVASFQLSKGSLLLKGSQGSREIRLAVYGSILFLLLLIQVVMSVRLSCAAGKLLSRPIHTTKVFGWWRGWSFVFLMILLVHAIFILRMMKGRKRKTISLIGMSVQSIFRIFGIIVIGQFNKKLEKQLSSDRQTLSIRSCSVKSESDKTIV